MRLPDGLRSRAVLIGTSQYQDVQLPNLPAVRHNIEDLANVLTNAHGVAIPTENCVSVVDVADPGTTWSILQDAADDAEDLLLVYYAGHGVLDQRGRLYLSLPATARKSYRWAALDISHIREVMADSGAHNRVLILDCCFSGRAYEAMGDSNAAALAVGQTEISGTYTLTSTSANTPAHAPVGERYTAFTGGLLDLLKHGIPGGPELLTLDDIYRNLRRKLLARNAPAPERKGTNNAGDLALVRNFAQHGPDQAPAQRLRVVDALFNAALTLRELGRPKERLDIYQQVVTDYRDDPAPAVRELVAKALIGNGLTLGELDRFEEATLVFDQVITGYRDDTTPTLREQVAKALIGKGFALGRLGRFKERLDVYEQVITDYRDDPTPTLREQVARALGNKGVSLGELDRFEEATHVFDQVITRYRDDTTPTLRELVAKALVNKGVTLDELGRFEEAVHVFEQVITNYRDDPALALRKQVVGALVSKGFALGKLGRTDEELDYYEQVITEYRDDTTPALRELVAKALVNKRITLGELNRSEEATRVPDTPRGSRGGSYPPATDR